MAIQKRINREQNKKLVGQRIEVLVEGPSPETEHLLVGRHEGQAPEIDGQVFLALNPDAKPPRQGDLVRARVTGFADYDLSATVEGVIERSRLKSIARLPVIAA
jgi:ribosomal protein S12 methylthiotransferase